MSHPTSAISPLGESASPPESPSSDTLLPALERRPTTSWRGSALLLIFGTVVAFLLIEVGFRIFIHEFPILRPRNDRPKRYFFPEGTKGMRDFRYTLKKLPDSYRVAVIGDSFTFGSALQFDDTYPKRLERILNLNKGGPKVEVLNLGIPGFSSTQETNLVRQAIQRESNLIVVQITLNDPAREPFRVTHSGFNHRGQVELRSPIFRYWKSLAFVWTRVLNTQSHRVYLNYYRGLFENPASWKRFVNAFKEMKRISSSKGDSTKLVVVTFPLFSMGLGENYPFRDIHQKITDMLNSLEIANIDLLPAFADISSERLEIIPGVDGHPNEIAHRIAAETIYRWLHRKKFIPPEIRVRNQKQVRFGNSVKLIKPELADEVPQAIQERK